MASPEALKVLEPMQAQPANKLCFDCGERNPNWVSLSHATFICLQCSGTHRSMGTHISFVRSVRMDKWTDAQLARMKVGGNEAAKQFFEGQPDISKGMSLPSKYSTWTASTYREKLDAVSQGRSWRRPERPAHAQRSASSNSLSNSVVMSSMSSDGAVMTPEMRASAANKDSYFARLQAQNESRSSNVPPSQGGKYVGFGSSGGSGDSGDKSTDRMVEDALASLSWGWSAFTESAKAISATVSAKAGELAKDLDDAVIQPTKEKVANGTLLDEVTQGMTKLAAKVSSAGEEGWKMLTQEEKARRLSEGRDMGRREEGARSNEEGEDWESWKPVRSTGSGTTATAATAYGGSVQSHDDDEEDGWNDVAIGAHSAASGGHSATQRAPLSPVKPNVVAEGWNDDEDW